MGPSGVRKTGFTDESSDTSMNMVEWTWSWCSTFNWLGILGWTEFASRPVWTVDSKIRLFCLDGGFSSVLGPVFNIRLGMGQQMKAMPQL
ncbi:hypothetical protein RhiXN_06201 [Rhizoctonia solani]|uniref:Uncharacterized protein n=1 Tax=Rhizoctonia solani TaxID=456999 RepID=A0A8H8P013_9AGAM|nr:uncharacterized protein RhiXN_06201 [Rhizoctonia solani]QRW21212.1 hypothetical protein RhiXN_06201 [Rhizoctonia solani]